MVSLARRRITPVVLVVLIVLVACYIAAGISVQLGAESVVEHLFLFAPAVLDGEVWRLLTYGLLHSLNDPMHLVWNGIGLFFFGPELELRFGRARFTGFLLLSVLAGGVAAVAAYALHIGTGLVIGFSAACQAAIVAWALLHRRREVLFMFAVPMRGIHFLWVSIAMWVLDAVSTSQMSAAAHLGGMIVGAVVGVLASPDLMARLRRRMPSRGPKLTVVPKKDDRWVN